MSTFFRQAQAKMTASDNPRTPPRTSASKPKPQSKPSPAAKIHTSSPSAKYSPRMPQKTHVINNDESDLLQQAIQSRLSNAIRSVERAEAEVERLCDIVEKAAEALKNARQAKKMAQRELDEAARAASASENSAGNSSRVDAGFDPGLLDYGGQFQMQPSQNGQYQGMRANVNGIVGNVPAGIAAVSTSSGVLAQAQALMKKKHGATHISNDSQLHPGALGGDRIVVNEDSVRGNGDNYEEEEEDSEDDDDYESEEQSTEDDEEEYDEEEEDDGLDVGNEALEQIRYRLDVAKIDPNSPDGTKLLDELLLRLQSAKERNIDVDLVNEFIDELLCDGTEEDPLSLTVSRSEEVMSPTSLVAQEGDHPHQDNADGNSAYISLSALNKDIGASGVTSPKHSLKQYPRIRILRNGKFLGWYQGQLDERGYSREGMGAMYYDAGHECHGMWKNDEMIGRGLYQWADGHVYDGEWEGGKRHGLGRFIRPDGVVLYGRYENGHHRGQGVRWSADKKEAQIVADGVPKKTISLVKAEQIARELGFEDVPPE